MAPPSGKQGKKQERNCFVKTREKLFCSWVRYSKKQNSFSLEQERNKNKLIALLPGSWCLLCLFGGAGGGGRRCWGGGERRSGSLAMQEENIN
jgi:hypothetical protein